METTGNMTGIDPVRLGPDSRFTFKCHKDVKCFTKCCYGINIVLTPYDIIRLKNRLELSSEAFLTLYTTPQILEKTNIPVVTMKLLPEEEDEDDKDNAKKGGKACPFVREDGCIVYEDRPTTCRYYPLGVASLSHKEGADDEDFYFFVHEPHCLGFSEKGEQIVTEWRRDQGVDIHDKINAEWTDLIVRKRSFPQNVQWTEQARRMFFLASYNIDKFKRFVFESSFLERHNIPEETLKNIREDEIALLQFGIKWLKGLLFKEDGSQEKGAS